MKKLTSFAFCLILLAGCAANKQALKTEAPKAEVKKAETIVAPAILAATTTPDTLLLLGFEDEKEITGIYKENDGPRDYPIEKVIENATQGASAMKITFPAEGAWPGPHFLDFARDWSGYDTLKIDIFNPTKSVVKVDFSFADADAGFSEQAYFGSYSKRYNADRIAKPGKNTIEIELTGASVEDGSRALNLKNMKRFALFMMSRPTDMVLYVDNIRLEKSKAE